MTAASDPAPPLTLRRVTRIWLPLAASWFCMGLELPLFTIFVARMANEDVNLAAYGGVVFPIALVIEAPIIMLLAASTALARDRQAVSLLRRFTHGAGLLLTTLHVLVAFTTLYDVVVGTLFQVSPEVSEAGRIGLRIMTPWTWTIAYRRFQQGILIRFERARAIAIGTVLRVLALLTVLSLGYAHGGIPGIVVGTSAIATGVTVEALFAGWCARPVLRERVPHLPEGAPLTVSAFLSFYVPLALTPFLTLLVPPLGAAAMSRMPQELPSLAAWPAVQGLVFLTRSVGFAFNEVVVTLVGLAGAVAVLRRFMVRLALVTMAVMLLLGLTPLAGFWFVRISDLNPDVYALATSATALAFLMPGNQAVQSYYQGALVHAKRTRPVTEAVAIYLVVAALALLPGVLLGRIPGILWVVPAFSLGGLFQTGWLAWRSRSVLSGLAQGTAPAEPTRA